MSYLDVGEVHFEHVGGRVAGVEEHELGFLQVVGRQAFLNLVRRGQGETGIYLKNPKRVICNSDKITVLSLKPKQTHTCWLWIKSHFHSYIPPQHPPKPQRLPHCLNEGNNNCGYPGCSDAPCLCDSLSVCVTTAVPRHAAISPTTLTAL